jgi:signal transduction histidine kinase
MFERWSLKLPITLGVILITLLILLTVGWVLMAISSVLGGWRHPAVFWTVLATGTLSLITVLVGVVMYLTLTIRTINLNQRQSNFIDAVTHELKSPIASLRLYLQTLMRQPVSEEQRQEFHQYMMEELQRLDQLINHLLAAARIERTRGESQAELVDLPELITELVDQLLTQYPLKREDIQLDLQPCAIEAVREDVSILLRNILDNAAKYAGEPPKIALRLHTDDRGRVVIQVEDNGRGVPHELRRRIFGRFVRLGDELVRDRPGTGLGLYLVRTITRRFRGWVRVRDPVQFDQGILFEVVLPAHCVSNRNTQGPSPSPAEPPTSVAS